MKVVTICGSMRFEKEMMEISRELEMKDICVLQCVYGFKNLSEEEISKLARLHYKKNRHFRWNLCCQYWRIHWRKR